MQNPDPSLDIDMKRMEQTAKALSSLEDAYAPVQFSDRPDQGEQVLGINMLMVDDASGKASIGVGHRHLNPN